jgi:outer membrane protein assembly factor BamE (lipoprotein component of BamABCDE complex)
MKRRPVLAPVLAAAVVAFAVTLAGCGQKRYGLDEFRSLVRGKTEAQVIEAVGEPNRIVKREQAEGKTYWYYVYRTRDQSTGQPIPETRVIFRNSKVDTVVVE